MERNKFSKLMEQLGRKVSGGIESAGEHIDQRLDESNDLVQNAMQDSMDNLDKGPFREPTENESALTEEMMTAVMGSVNPVQKLGTIMLKGQRAAAPTAKELAANKVRDVVTDSAQQGFGTMNEVATHTNIAGRQADFAARNAEALRQRKLEALRKMKR